MMLVLFLLAIAMIATGVTSAIYGAPIVQLERGHTMIIAGSGVASAGAILLGLTFLCYRLKRIQREVRRLGDRLTRQVGLMTSPSAVEPVNALEPVDEPLPSLDPPSPTVVAPGPPIEEMPRPRPPQPTSQPVPPPKPAAEPTIVGKYASGGNSYVMYSDGSISADTPSGHHRFSSLDDLKAFVAAGGERR